MGKCCGFWEGGDGMVGTCVFEEGKGKCEVGYMM